MASARTTAPRLGAAASTTTLRAAAAQLRPHVAAATAGMRRGALPSSALATQLVFRRLGLVPARAFATSPGVGAEGEQKAGGGSGSQEQSSDEIPKQSFWTRIKNSVLDLSDFQRLIVFAVMMLFSAGVMKLNVSSPTSHPALATALLLLNQHDGLRALLLAGPDAENPIPKGVDILQRGWIFKGNQWEDPKKADGTRGLSWCLAPVQSLTSKHHENGWLKLAIQYDKNGQWHYDSITLDFPTLRQRLRYDVKSDGFVQMPYDIDTTLVTTWESYLSYGLALGAPVLAAVGIFYWNKKNRLVTLVRNAMIHHPTLTTTFGTPVRISAKYNGKVDRDLAQFTCDVTGPTKRRGTLSVNAVRKAAAQAGAKPDASAANKAAAKAPDWTQWSVDAAVRVDGNNKATPLKVDLTPRHRR